MDLVEKCLRLINLSTLSSIHVNKYQYNDCVCVIDYFFQTDHYFMKRISNNTNNKTINPRFSEPMVHEGSHFLNSASNHDSISF